MIICQLGTKTDVNFYRIKILNERWQSCSAMVQTAAVFVVIF